MNRASGEARRSAISGHCRPRRFSPLRIRWIQITRGRGSAGSAGSARLGKARAERI